MSELRSTEINRPGYIGGGGGIKGKASSISSPSWAFFKSSTPLLTEDFAGFATMATGEITQGIVAALAYCTFWSVDHDPYWIPIGGVTVGASIGASITILGLRGNEWVKRGAE